MFQIKLLSLALLAMATLVIANTNAKHTGITPRIVNGENAIRGQFPFYVHVQVITRAFLIVIFSTIISKDYHFGDADIWIIVFFSIPVSTWIQMWCHTDFKWVGSNGRSLCFNEKKLSNSIAFRFIEIRRYEWNWTKNYWHNIKWYLFTSKLFLVPWFIRSQAVSFWVHLQDRLI